MNHAAEAATALPLASHVHKGVHLAHHVAIGDIPSVLSPFAREDTATGRILRQGLISEEGQPLCSVQPRAFATA
jgi:hypothetical protein